MNSKWMSTGILVAIVALFAILSQSLKHHRHKFKVGRGLRTPRKLEETFEVQLLMELLFVNHEMASNFDDSLLIVPINDVVAHFCEAVNAQASGPQVVSAADEIGAVFETRQFVIGNVVDYECSIRDTNRVYDSDAEDTFGVGFFILELSVQQTVHVTSTGPLSLEEISRTVKNGFNRGSGGRVRFRSLLQRHSAFNTIVTVEVLEDSLSAPQEAPSARPSQVPTGFPTSIPSGNPSSTPSATPTTTRPSSFPSYSPSQTISSRPSAHPSGLPPSVAPSSRMTISSSAPTLPDPVRGSPSDESPEEKNNVPLILGAIAGAVTTILVSCFFIIVVWRPCIKKVKEEEDTDGPEPKASVGQETMTISSSHLEGAMVTCSDDTSSLANTTLGDKTAGYFFPTKAQLEGHDNDNDRTNSFDENSIFTSPASNSVTESALVEAASYESSMVLPLSVTQVADFEDDFIITDEARSTDDSETGFTLPSAEASQMSLAQHSPLAALELSDDENSSPFVDGEDTSSNSSYQTDSVEDDLTPGPDSPSEDHEEDVEDTQSSSLDQTRQTNNVLLRNVLEDARLLSQMTSRSVSSLPTTKSAPPMVVSPVQPEIVDMDQGTSRSRPREVASSSRSVGSPPEPRSFRDFGDKAPHVPNRPSVLSKPVVTPDHSIVHSQVKEPADQEEVRSGDGEDLGGNGANKESPVFAGLGTYESRESQASETPDFAGEIFTAPTPKTENISKVSDIVLDSRLFGESNDEAPTLGAKAWDDQRLTIPHSGDGVIGNQESEESFATTDGILSGEIPPTKLLGKEDEDQDDDMSDDSDGLSNPWLFGTLEQTLGPRSATADMDSMSVGSNRSHRSSTSSSKSSTPLRRPRSASSSPEETQKSLEGISSTIAPRSLDTDLKRLQQQLADVVQKGEPSNPVVSPSVASASASASAADSSKSTTPTKSTVGTTSKPKTLKRKQVVVVVPPGRVGVVLANRHDGNGTIVSEVLPSSSMHNILSPEDKLVAINGIDVTKLQIAEITNLMASLSDKPRRLTIITSVKQVSVPEWMRNGK